MNESGALDERLRTYVMQSFEEVGELLPIDDETLGFGYPLWDGIGDPNPITIEGFGSLEIDFFFMM
ncbi:MAG: hypothetical protein GY702_11560 [Desulfobulbaceae bacterium]|nr:hypothetical protein [Desulfobulbaceae bacterium]